MSRKPVNVRYAVATVVEDNVPRFERSKPFLRRHQYVRVQSARYEWSTGPGGRIVARKTHEAGEIGLVVDLSSHPWSGGHRGVEGVFIATVRLRDGTRTQVNERALVPCFGP